MSAPSSNTSVLPQPRFGLLTRLHPSPALETVPMKGAAYS